MTRGAPRAFVLYWDSPLRRAALGSEPGSGERYTLYGLEELADAGFAVGHNLEHGMQPGAPVRVAAAILDRITRLAGGYSGDFATVVRSLPDLRRADVVLSTVDTVGIPLVLLARAGLVRAPIVYVAIGLPERLARLRSTLARRVYASAFRRLHTMVAYGAGEADALRAWLGDEGPRVVFVPFGVDTAYFQPDSTRRAEFDVVSAGNDPRRDFALLVEIARRRPEWAVRIVASHDHARELVSLPANVSVERDVPLSTVRERLSSARVVVLPVHENSYSGATTVLLQAMACAKPVVVSRTAAIARGYHLDDGVNCRLVAPGDASALERAVNGLLEDPEAASRMGTEARETVERHLTWSRYVAEIQDAVWTAVADTTVSA